jgi:hypothetical protein
MVRPCSCSVSKYAGKGHRDKEHATSEAGKTAAAVIGIDIGKNSFHIVGLNRHGVIVLRERSGGR